MPAAPLDYVLLIPSLAISLFIAVPLTGVLVRFRANYTPRGLALDTDGAAFPHTGPVVNSYFGMFRRVWQIEGFSGLYKGLMPTFLTALVVSLAIITFTDAPNSRHSSYRAPATGILGTLFYSLFMMLLSLPSAIITYRAITTPHRLAYLQPIKALRVLLTPTERRRPWIIYLTPGLLFTQCLHVAYVTLILSPLHRLLVPMSMGPGVAYPEISPVKLTIYFAVVIVSTGLLTPLEVISTRLAIQRNQGSAEYNSVTQEVEGDAEEVPEYAGAEEDVIGLRTEAEPYTGLVDCAKTIINEEGFRALYRAWWITLLGGLLSAFA
ncbi:hypothetical protein B0H19DRAFT_43111 [Mycena capillaripes]|nr:hypothetical protein B0H19DRAFT_43111 [Mycena capillaripes]